MRATFRKLVWGLLFTCWTDGAWDGLAMLITIVALGPFSLLELAYTFAKPADARNIVAFYVEANWGARHAAELTAYLGASQLKEKLSDPAQLPMRLNQESTAGADAAIGALTALQRELLERHASSRSTSASSQQPSDCRPRCC